MPSGTFKQLLQSSKEAITLHTGDLCESIFGIGAECAMQLATIALETVVGIAHEADVVAHFETFAFGGRMNLGNDATSFMADDHRSPIVGSKALHDIRVA